MYKLHKDLNGVIYVIERMSDKVYIPFADGNTDYEEYKLWLEAGNTPLPAEE